MNYKPSLVFSYFSVSGDVHPDYLDTYTLRIESDSDIERYNRATSEKP